MHSAATLQHCRFCNRLALGRAKLRNADVLSAPQLHVERATTIRASSVVDHAEAHVLASHSHEKVAAANTDIAAVSSQRSRQRNLDDSLPYVAVLKATKQHRHPVQEQQRALGMVQQSA